MKDPTLSWLLDPKDPSVRQQALLDLLHRRKDARDVVAAGDKISSYRPVKKIIASQTSKGFWSPKNDCYRPKWTSAVWQLALLGELGVPADSQSLLAGGLALLAQPLVRPGEGDLWPPT